MILNFDFALPCRASTRRGSRGSPDGIFPKRWVDPNTGVFNKNPGF